MGREDTQNSIILNARIRSHPDLIDIACEGGIITEIGSIGGDGIDACGRLVCPGFVNAHTHLDKADLLLQMKPSDFGKSLTENRELLKRFKVGYEIEEIRKRAKRVIREFIANGVTAIRTQVDVDGTGGLKACEALNGIKEELPIELQICTFPQEGVLDENARSLVEQALDAGADLMGGLPLVEKTEEGHMQHIDVLFEIAKKHDVDLDIQLDESNDPRDFMLPYLIEKTIECKWQGRVTATHCISLSAQDENIIKETSRLLAQARINVITTPSANMITRFDLPEGIHSRPSNSIAPLIHLVDAGVNVAIGTDNIRDIFYPMGNCSMLREMHVAQASTRMCDQNAPQRLIDMATVNGGRILGLNYGIHEGAAADILILGCDAPSGVLNGPENIPMVIRSGRLVCESSREVEYG